MPCAAAYDASAPVERQPLEQVREIVKLAAGRTGAAPGRGAPCSPGEAARRLRMGLPLAEGGRAGAGRLDYPFGRRKQTGGIA